MKNILPHFLKILTSICFFFLLSYQSKASHLIGGDMSYQYIGSNQYKITLKLYRDCQGIPLCNCPNTTGCNVPIIISATNSLGNTVIFDTIKMNINTSNTSSGFDIVNVCSSVKTVCTNCGTRNPGTFTPGVEVYEFTNIVNLANYNITDCMVSIGYSSCCRNSAITTLQVPSSLSHYIGLTINTCETRGSSPIFNNPAAIVMCAGQEFNYNLGAVDPDGDSLSYEFAPTLTQMNTPAPYKSPYQYATFPFPYLGSPNVNLPRPLGVHIDAVTGDIHFTPTGTFVANFVVLVKQWKYDDPTFPCQKTLVGTTTRDIQIYSTSCATNNPPNFKTYDTLGIPLANQTNTTINFTKGVQNCMIVVASDANILDTTDINLIATDFLSNKGQYSFTRLYNTSTRAINGPRQDSVKICWTPGSNTHVRESYFVTFGAKDRVCPISASNVQSVTFNILQPSINIKIPNKACAKRNTLAYVTSIGSIFNTGNTFTLQMSDQFGSFANPIIKAIKTSVLQNESLSFYVNDSMGLTKRYYRIVSSNPVMISDTQSMMNVGSPFAELATKVPRGCYGDSILLKPVYNNYDSVVYRWHIWYTNPVTHVASNKYIDSVALLTIADSVSLIVNSFDCMFCSDTTAITKINYYTSKPSLAGNTTTVGFCNTSSNIINIKKALGAIKYDWYLDDVFYKSTKDTFLNINTNDVGLTVIATDTNQCKDTLKILVTNKITVSAALKIVGDTNSCGGAPVNLSFTNSSQIDRFYYQKNGVHYDSTSKSINVSQSGLYRLIIVSKDGCRDTSRIVTINIKPVPSNKTTPSDSAQFCSGDFVQIKSTIIDTLGMQFTWYKGLAIISNSSMININSIGTYSLKIMSNNGCSAISNSIIVKQVTSPKIIISPSVNVGFCQGKSVTLFANGATSYYWRNQAGIINSSIGLSSIQVNTAGQYMAVGSIGVGCKDSSTFVNVSQAPNQVKPNIIQSSDTLTSSEIAAQYNWYIDEKIIPNAIAQSYIATLNGLYRVKVSNAFGCSDSSNDYSYIKTGMPEIGMDNIRLYPNPTSTYALLEFVNNANWQVSIYDVSGKIVRSYKAFKSKELSIQKENLKTGVYLLHIKNIDNNKTSTMKLMIE